MSYRARRLPGAAGDPFPWEPLAYAGHVLTAGPVFAEEDAEDTEEQRLAALERDAFARGYEQGERAAAAAAAAETAIMLQRVSRTIDELASLRREIIRRTERQTVQLVLALAERVVHREITLDRSLLMGMARSALDRLGDYGTATIRLHPEDFKAIGQLGEIAEGLPVRVLSDPAIARGGCLVESDFGLMDASPDAQFRELARALLSEEGGEGGRGTGVDRR
jgi:flagellar assembly protein FliH